MSAGQARLERDPNMAEQAATGRCLDVELFGRRHPYKDGVWEILHYQPGVTYRVGSTETWISSIGRERRSGRVYASVDERFWLDAGFESLPLD